MSETPREVFEALLVTACTIGPSPQHEMSRAEWLARFDAAVAARHAAAGVRVDDDGEIRILADTSGGLAPREWVRPVDAGEHRLAAALRELLVSEPADGWISVEERLPESGESVLAVTAGGVEIGRRGLGRWANFEGDALDVTHWRPLPEPPK